MSRGGPDYNSPDYSVAVRNVDSRDIETAIIGIGSADARGRLFMFDTFKDGLGAWQLSKSGGASLPVTAVDMCEVPPASCKLSAGATAAVDTSAIAKTIVIGDAFKFGVEVGYLVDVNRPMYYFLSQVRTSTTVYSAAMRLDPVNLVLQVLDNVTYRTVHTFLSALAADSWHSLKYTFDCNTGRYLRAILGQVEIDLSRYSASSSPFTGCGDLTLTVRAVSTGPTNVPGYIGHILVTVDEP